MSSKAQITMNIKTKHWERSLTMQAWSLGRDRSLVKVLKPLKERGIATLKVGKEVYNYLPDTDRTIKITSAMMLGSWMGSHFTNDDLVKESRMADDYRTVVSLIGAREGVPIIELTSTPKPDAAVVWGRVVTTVRAGDWQPLTVLFYDEDGKPARTMTLSGHKSIGGRVLPTVMKMVPADKPGEHTEVIYDDIAFGTPLPDGFFSLNQLRR
jgi:outer membrane lipoprotein-sorting protein